MADTVTDPDAECRIKKGDYVVLKRGDVYKSVQIDKKKKVIFEKQWIFLDGAVEELYGSTFEVDAGGKLSLRKANNTENSAETKEAGLDNRHIVDDGKSQRLTRDDIESLKEKGLKGQEIIQQLIDNSTTFRDKTEFAQEKYIKKKKKKYESHITVLKPTSRILAMMYHGREPGKICHLRYDTLAQLLTLGNIHAGSKIIVFETCAGLVLGSVMERMGGYGSVIQMYAGGGPVRAAMDSFGFPSHFHATLHEFPLCKVNALLAGTLDEKDQGSVDEKDRGGQNEGRSSATPQRSSGGSEGVSAEPQSMEGCEQPDRAEEREQSEKLREQKAQEKRVKLEEKRRRLAGAAALLEGRDADGLVIASRFHPCPVLVGLLKFVTPSRPFVVYCQYREPLIECYTKLREQGGAINLRLTDTWTRHYQVLPNRTHPMLMMSGGGGYLLSGITVAAAPATSGARQNTASEPTAKRIKLDEISGTSNSSA